MSTTVEWECDYLDYLAGRRPDLTREHFLRNQAGKAMGGPPLETRMARMAQLDALWHAAETKAAENNAAMARTLCRIAASVPRQPAPDALAAYGAQGGAEGRQDALLVLRAAGYDPDPVEQARREQARRRQPSTVAGDPWASDPAHDDRVTEALREGRSMAEVADIVAQVTAERDQAKKEQLAAAAAAGHDPRILWTTREGTVLYDEGATSGRPLIPQRSVVHTGVPELGSEPVPPAPPFPSGER